MPGRYQWERERGVGVWSSLPRRVLGPDGRRGRHSRDYISARHADRLSELP